MKNIFKVPSFGKLSLSLIPFILGSSFAFSQKPVYRRGVVMGYEAGAEYSRTKTLIEQHKANLIRVPFFAVDILDESTNYEIKTNWMKGFCKQNNLPLTYKKNALWYYPGVPYDQNSKKLSYFAYIALYLDIMISELRNFEKWISLDGGPNTKTIGQLLLENHVKVCISIFSPPGGQFKPFNEVKKSGAGAFSIFQSNRIKKINGKLDSLRLFVDTCGYFADRLKKNGVLKYIWGFDILNEPILRGGWSTQAKTWSNYAEIAGWRFRHYAPHLRLVVQAPLGNPRILPLMRKLRLNKTTYSFHFYGPHTYTHNFRKNEKGSYVLKDASLRYPGSYKDPSLGFKKKAFWNLRQINDLVKPIFSFSQKNRVKIYVGEFSTFFRNKDADVYLQHCIRIWEKFGFHWSFYSYNHSIGGKGQPWDIENMNPTAWSVIQGGLRKNQ
jgi:hypothetical protein